MASSINTSNRITVVARQYDTVDQLCWRHLGRTAGATEATLAANPGLSDTPHLAAGQRVTLVAPAAAPRQLVQLWD